MTMPHTIQPIRPLASRPSRAHSRHGRGFTLVEVVTSLAIITILMLAMGSAIVLASRALPQPTDAVQRVLADSRVVDQIAAELTYATTVTELTAASVKFTVDRGGTVSTIDYTWSGVEGEPLYRAIDGGESVVVASDVASFEVSYEFEVLPSGETPPLVETAEQQYLQQDEATTNGSPGSFYIDGSSACGQSFLPALAADAISWQITRVSFVAAPDAIANGVLAVSVQGTGSGGEPDGAVIDEVLVQESDLVAGAWHEVAFTAAGDLDPSAPYYVVFAHDGGSGFVAIISVDDGVTNTPETVYYEDDGSGTWTEVTGRDTRMWVWGTALVPDPDWIPPPPDERVLTISVGLRSGNDAAMPVATTVLMLNQPVLAGGGG